MNVVVKPIFVDLPVAALVLSLSESTVQALTRDKESGFPQPRKLSGRRVGYLLREIEAWGETRPVSELLPPENTGAKKPRIAKARAITPNQLTPTTPSNQKAA